MEEIAQVYARSLFEVASEQDKLDGIREELGTFADGYVAVEGALSPNDRLAVAST